MTTYRRNIALVVEGMGSDTSKSGGIAWHFGQASIATPGTYEWVGGSGSGEGLVTAPESVACSVEPFECELNGNAHQFRLHATAQAKGLWIGRPEKPRDALLTAIDENATTLVFGLYGYTWSAGDDDTVVWIGDEAILIGTWSAGGTVGGCTRGYWGTTAQAQPAGMNVYGRNPKRVNRLARLLVYDRDAGTTTQAWQGFVTGYKVDNGVLTVDCQDIWSAVPGAMVNRKVEKGLERFIVGGYINATTQEVSAGANIRPETRSRKRVSKADATKPHWMAYQIGGAVAYAQCSAGGQTASFIDEGTVSKSALGSAFDAELGRGGAPSKLPLYELLVVDRLRDQEAGSDVVYANMRSSSRDLDEPFHPVALSMAILTSGHSTVPGAVAPVPAIPSFVLYEWVTTSGLGALSHEDDVAAWTDTVAAVDMEQATTGNKPTYVAADATANGLPALKFGRDFSTTAAHMAAALSAAEAQPYTIAMLLSSPASQLDGDARYYWSRGGASGGSMYDAQVLAAYQGLYMAAGSAVDTGIDVPTGRQRLLVGRYDGASSSGQVDDTAGGSVSAGTDALDDDLRIGADGSGTGGLHGYVQGVWICDGSLSAGEMDELQAYVDYHFATGHTPGTFPEFGSTDCFELDAEDLATADGATVATDWTDRINAYAFTPGGTPTMRTTLGPHGGKAIEFSGGADYFDCAGIGWSQPGTIIAEVRYDYGAAQGGVCDGLDASNRWVIYNFGGVSLFAGSANVSLSANVDRLGWRHLAGVFNGASSRIAIDGQGAVTGNPGAHGIGSGLRIGAFYDASNAFDGRISWVGGWDVALTEAQIREVLAYRGLI